MTKIQILPATAADLPAILKLLESQSLPLDGLEDHLSSTFVAKEGNEIVGSVAIEVYPEGGLLRSVAVAKNLQGQGVGRALTDAAFRMSRERQISTLFLLTTTAENYFPKFGFQPITREDVPPSVRASIEFTTACPSSAVVMRTRLSKDAEG
jgi:amino-acid N-acetyltransferase